MTIALIAFVPQMSFAGIWNALKRLNPEVPHAKQIDPPHRSKLDPQNEPTLRHRQSDGFAETHWKISPEEAARKEEAARQHLERSVPHSAEFVRIQRFPTQPRRVETQLTAREQVEIVAIVPEDEAAYRNVFLSGDKNMTPSAAEMNHVRNVRRQFESLDARFVSSEGQTLESLFEDAAKRDVRLVVIIGHSTSVKSPELALNERLLHMPDGTSISLADVHKSASKYRLNACVVTCHGPDISIGSEITYNQAIDCCRHALAPLEDIHGVENVGSFVSRASNRRGQMGAIEVHFCFVLGAIAFRPSDLGDAANDIVISRMARPRWRWLVALITPFLGYGTLMTAVCRVGARPKCVCNVTELKRSMGARIEDMKRLLRHLGVLSLGLLVALVVVPLFALQFENGLDDREGITAAIVPMRLPSYVAVFFAAVGWMVSVTRPEASSLGKIVHTIAGALSGTGFGLVLVPIERIKTLASKEAIGGCGGLGVILGLMNGITSDWQSAVSGAIGIGIGMMMLPILIALFIGIVVGPLWGLVHGARIGFQGAPLFHKLRERLTDSIGTRSADSSEVGISIENAQHSIADTGTESVQEEESFTFIIEHCPFCDIRVVPMADGRYPCCKRARGLSSIATNPADERHAQTIGMGVG